MHVQQSHFLSGLSTGVQLLAAAAVELYTTLVANQTISNVIDEQFGCSSNGTEYWQ